MILGIGTDVIEIKHLKEAIKKKPKIIERLFTPTERKRAQKLSQERKMSFYAKRFSGKEAISKACGTGIGGNISWLDLEISNNQQGAPVVTLSENATKFLKKKFKTKNIRVFISLSDEKDFALAFCVLTK